MSENIVPKMKPEEQKRTHHEDANYSPTVELGQPSEAKNVRTEDGSDGQHDQATAYSQDDKNIMYSIDRPDNMSKTQKTAGRGQQTSTTKYQSKHISDQNQYHSITSYLPQMSNKDGELSQYQNHGSSYQEARPQSRGRTSGGYFEPGSTDQQLFDSNMAFPSQQKPLSPDAQTGINVARGSSIQQQSILDHGNVFTPQVKQRHQHLLMNSVQGYQKEAQFVSIYGPDQSEHYGYGYGSKPGVRRPNYTNQRSRFGKQNNLPLELTSTMSPHGQVFTPGSSNYQTGIRTRDNMSSEYQNFLKMTQPFPTEPDWLLAQNNKLNLANDPRGDQNRQGSLNLSQDLMNNFVSRNIQPVTTPNSRFGKRPLDPITHPPNVLSRGTQRPYDGAYTFVQWVDQSSPARPSRLSRLSMPVVDVNNQQLMGGKNRPPIDTSIGGSFLSVEEEQLLNDLRMYRQIKIKTANIVPERQLKYAQEREMQRQLQDRNHHRRRGTADYRKEAQHSHFEREHDKFEQMRRRICQSQKGGARSMAPPKGQIQQSGVRTSYNGSTELRGSKGFGVDTVATNDYLQEQSFHLPPAAGKTFNKQQHSTLAESIQKFESNLPGRKGKPTDTTIHKTIASSAERPKSQEPQQIEQQETEKQTEKQKMFKIRADKKAYRELRRKQNRERRERFEKLMEGSVQIFNKLQEMERTEIDEDDDDDYYDVYNQSFSQSRQNPMANNNQSPRYVKPSQAKITKQNTLNDIFNGQAAKMPITRKSTQGQQAQQQLGLQPLFSSAAQPNSKVTFFNKDKESKTVREPAAKTSSTGPPALPLPPGLKLVGNMDIYKQVATTPSRAPEIIFGNLKHNQLLYKEFRNAQRTKKSRPSAKGRHISQIAKANAFASQMSVASGMQKSSINDELMQMRMDNNNKPNQGMQPPEKRSNFDVTGNMQPIHINSSVSMKSMGGHGGGQNSPQYAQNRYMNVQTSQMGNNQFDPSMQMAPQSMSASPLGNVASMDIDEQENDHDDDELDQKLSGELTQMGKRVQFKNGDLLLDDKDGTERAQGGRVRHEGPVRWNFSAETMKHFGLTYEDIKVKIPSVSPQRIINHVVVNKQTVQNYQYIREINFYQNLLKSAHNRDQAKRTLALINQAHRMEKEEKLHRWDEFRNRRLDVMDLYLATKRRCMSIRALLIVVSTHMALKMIMKAIEEERRARIMKYQAARISLLLYVKIKRSMKRQGGMGKMNLNRLRYSFNFGGSMLNHRIVEFDLKKVMEYFLIKQMFRNEIIQKVRDFQEKIRRIKRRFRDQYETKDEKLRVLKRLWDKRLREFEEAANQIGNPRMKKLVMDLKFTVPSAVKTAVLREYIRKCNQKYIIAFLQWRYRYPPKDLHDPDKVHYYNKESMRESMKKMSQIIIKSIDISRKPKEKTIQKANIDPKDDKDFQQVLGDPYEEIDKNMYTIVTFWQIGMADPFPDGQTQDFSDQSLLKNNNNIKIDDLVYPEKRYVEGMCPLMMYIPGKYLMFKMMRACLGCKNENDLWFNREWGRQDDSDHSDEQIDYDKMQETEKQRKEAGLQDSSDETPRLRQEDPESLPESIANSSLVL